MFSKIVMALTVITLAFSLFNNADSAANAHAVGLRQDADHPQLPVAPFPYSTEEVSVANAGAVGVTLAGTLTTPQGDGPFPAAILVSGSGPHDRDMTWGGHKMFAVMAHHLTQRGIAVLRLDDRGIAASTGDFANATAMCLTMPIALPLPATMLPFSKVCLYRPATGQPAKPC